MSHEEPDFFSAYLDYCNLDKSECPAVYHRWGCAVAVSALLGRSVWVEFGHGVIYPNQYVLFMGPPASKKGTAISMARKILKGAGYTRFSADRTSKEAFLKSMKQFESDSPNAIEDLEAVVLDAPSETFILAGEFVDFIGQGDTGFMMLLTNLWDNLDIYVHPKITGRDVVVDRPTVNMLGGSTPTTFALAFPPEALGSGFLSRVLLIHSDGSGAKVAWPEPGDPLKAAMLQQRLLEMKKMKGCMEFSPAAKELITDIYKNCVPLDDSRFVHYMDRRHIHLIKLSMILAVCDGRMMIEPGDVIKGNTMLAASEVKMTKALGEFGSSKLSAGTSTVLSYLGSKRMPQNASDIWKAVHNDITKMSELLEILNNLLKAEKIQTMNVKGKVGYLPLNKVAARWDDKFLDKGWLTPQENFL